MVEEYNKLAQLCTIIETDFINKESILDEFLKQNKRIVNNQIPENNYFKLKNPDLIGCTPLHLAFRKKELNIFEKLIDSGADFTIKNAQGETVFYQTVSEYLKDTEISKWKRTPQPCFVDLMLTKLIKSNNSANPSNNDGISHFHLACLTNETDAIEIFLNAGEPINQAVNFNSPILPGYTPLHFAARYFNLGVVKVLLQYGADIDLRDAKGMSPLHMLIGQNMELINLPYGTSDNCTILQDIEEWDSTSRPSRQLNNFRFVDFESADVFRRKFDLNNLMILLITNLVSAEYDYKVIDSIGLSNFQVACCLRDISTIKPFLKNNVNLNHSISADSPIWPGYTALHFAARFDIEAMRLLLKKGSSILAKDARGITPLDLLLRRHDFHEVCPILICSEIKWKRLYFSDGKTKVLDFIFSMHTFANFESFMKSMNINTSIPHNSVVWPGYTPLHLIVALCKRNEILDIFKYSQRDDDVYDNYDAGKNCAVVKGYLQRIRRCLDLGADVTVKNARGWTPLHLAFYENKFVIANLLLEMHPHNVNPIDQNGFSHLHIACYLKNNVEKFARAPDINSSVISSFIAGEVDCYYDAGESRRGCYVNAGSTPLHVIVSCSKRVDFNTKKLINKLIEYGADIHAKDSNGFTPIHRIFTCRVHMIDKRDSQKTFSLANIEDRVSDCGLSYLHIACCTRDAPVVERMIDLGADVNRTIAYEESERIDDVLGNPHRFVKDYAGCAPLHFAVEGNWDKVISVLLRRGADVLARKADGSVLLSNFLIKSSLHKKRVFFEEYKNNAAMQKYIEKESGLTILHIACAALDFHAIERTLNEADEAGVNAVAFANSPVWPGCTPLHVLAMEGKRTSREERKSVGKIIEMMIDKGANVLLQNEKMKTPLHEMVDRLFSFDTYSRREMDLISAMLKGHRDYSVNPIDVTGISHFHIACMCDDVNVVKAFLDNGMDVNKAIEFFVDEFGGCTALHVAVAQKSVETVKLLLQYNANVNAKNVINESPVQAVAFRKDFHCEDLDLLVKAGAHINDKNLFGEMPLESLMRLYENKKVYYIDDNEIIKTALNFRCRVNVFVYREMGFLGRNIRHTVPKRNSQQNSDRNPTVDQLIQAVIQAPEMNDVDSLGRNVIHNIVSVDRAFESSRVEKEYVRVIGEFTKVGFDIDQQDKRGYTPLHNAATFKNLDGIIGLLNYGADVNIFDARGRTAYACVSSSLSVEDDDNTIMKIDTVIQRHFNKLKYFKLQVNSINQHFIDAKPNLAQTGYYKASARDKQFKSEVQRVKNITIDPYLVTLDDFLSDTGAVAAYVFKGLYERRTINEFFQCNRAYLYQNFPELMSILYLQYRKAIARTHLVIPAAFSLNFLAKCDLPCLCTEVVLRFLTNDDLKNLIASTNVDEAK